MSKVIVATCEDGKVTAEGVEVPSAEIFSEGEASSEGLLILDGDKAYYVAKTSPDLKTTLQKLTTALGKVSSALSALDGAHFLVAATGGVPSGPLIATPISELNAVKAELEDLTDSLR